jgi:HSP20 family protein
MLMRIDPFHGFGRVQSWTGASTFRMDAYRSGDKVEIAIDLPGVSPEAIEVTVDKDVLTIKASRSTRPEGEVEPLVSERQSGSFTRRLFLGRKLDGEHLTATYENGVLHLSVPVADSEKPRRIEVGQPAPAIEATSSPEAA